MGSLPSSSLPSIVYHEQGERAHLSQLPPLSLSPARADLGEGGISPLLLLSFPHRHRRPASVCVSRPSLLGWIQGLHDRIRPSCHLIRAENQARPRRGGPRLGRPVRRREGPREGSPGRAAPGAAALHERAPLWWPGHGFGCFSCLRRLWRTLDRIHGLRGRIRRLGNCALPLIARRLPRTRCTIWRRLRGFLAKTSSRFYSVVCFICDSLADSWP
jgi:hypothetical protein